jgi:amidase
MASGALTSAALTMGYINRIKSLNPTLHAVIEVNPNALAIATSLDNERSAGHVRGPLHGIPILVKDNIATNDNTQTTAGSLAIYGNHVPGDSVVIQHLRAAGAVILGKSNLGEWANFRSAIPIFPLAVGWSARGGNTINAYDLSYTSWGSSSGSGNHIARSVVKRAGIVDGILGPISFSRSASTNDSSAILSARKSIAKAQRFPSLLAGESPAVLSQAN